MSAPCEAEGCTEDYGSRSILLAIYPVSQGRCLKLVNQEQTNDGKIVNKHWKHTFYALDTDVYANKKYRFKII